MISNIENWVVKPNNLYYWVVIREQESIKRFINEIESIMCEDFDKIDKKTM